MVFKVNFICNDIIIPEFFSKLDGAQIKGNQLTECLLKSVGMYKRLHIIVGSFNRAHSQILVSFLFILIAAVVISAVMVIPCIAEGNFADSQLVFINCVYVQWMLNAVISILGAYGGFGTVNDCASKGLGQMKRLTFQVENKRSFRMLNRMVRALPLMKIDFGGTNFIEKLTPFVYLDFAFRRVIDGLLLSKQ